MSAAWETIRRQLAHLSRRDHMKNEARSNTSIDLTYKCNNCCIFCSTSRFRERPPRSLGEAEIFAQIALAAESGASDLVFSGGEPTLVEPLPRYVEFARRHGIPNIGVVTNGRSFASLRYAHRMRDAGLTNASVSLHGWDEASNTLLTRMPEAHAQTLAGIRNLLAVGVRVIQVVVVIAHNFRELDRIVETSTSLGIRQFQFKAYAGEPPNPVWMVPPVDLGPALERACLRIAEVGGEALLFHLPICLVQQAGHVVRRERVHMRFIRCDGIEPCAHEDPGSNVKWPGCATCRDDPFCMGFDSFYAARFDGGFILPRNEG